VPTGQMRRIDQNSFTNLEWAADGDTDRSNRAAFMPRSRNQGLDMPDNLGKSRSKWLSRMGLHLNPLQDLPIKRSFYASCLRPAYIQADHRARGRFSIMDSVGFV